MATWMMGEKERRQWTAVVEDSGRQRWTAVVEDSGRQEIRR